MSGSPKDQQSNNQQPSKGTIEQSIKLGSNSQNNFRGMTDTSVQKSGQASQVKPTPTDNTSTQQKRK